MRKLHAAFVATVATGVLALSPEYAFAGAGLATPVINSVLTSYSGTGVPTAITVFGTGLCSTSTCSTKPAVTLGGVALTPVTGTATGITGPLGVIVDGTYVLTVKVGSAAATLAINIQAKTTSGSGGSSTVAVGSTTTGLPGTAAVVTNSGTATAAQLNFTIPRGDTGPQGIQGPVGATGPQGIQGPVGAMGLTGVDGPQGDPGLSMNFVGPWSAAYEYGARDIVTVGGSSYEARFPNIGINPASVNPSIESGEAWMLLAAKGSDGAPGSVGAVGPQGPPGIQGPVGPDGPQGPRGLRGEQGFIGPVGLPGIQGVKGDQGDKGEPGTNGAPGDKGEKGDPGSPGLLKVVDANGKEVGRLLFSGANEPDLVLATFATRPFVFVSTSYGFSGNWSSATYFESNDCTGPQIFVNPHGKYMSLTLAFPRLPISGGSLPDGMYILGPKIDVPIGSGLVRGGVCDSSLRPYLGGVVSLHYIIDTIDLTPFGFVPPFTTVLP